MPGTEIVKAQIVEIEAELRRLGLWRDEPLEPEAYNFSQAFAMDTMPFSSWLQFIFIPRVKEIIESDRRFPSSSQVGAQAIREFDGDNAAAHLVDLLIAFDELF
ncbi:MAG: YqcC family protein [Chloroflexota bacterium]